MKTRKTFYSKVVGLIFGLTIALVTTSLVIAAAGLLDTTFDSDGKVLIQFGTVQHDMGQDVAIQADGKIVVVGSSESGPSDNDFSIARLNSDGSLDTSFSGDGKLILDIGTNTHDFAYSVEIDSDGKIVVGGVSGLDFAVIRLNTDGSLDTTFSADGKVVTDIDSDSADLFEGMTIQSDNKIVAVGSKNDVLGSLTNDQIAVVRYNANGSLDSTFDNDGIRVSDLITSSETGYGVAVQDDGMTVVTGSGYLSGNTSIFLIRYQTNGALDTSFGSSGIVFAEYGGTYNMGRRLAIQKDGKIVVAGACYVDSAQAFSVLRFTASGVLDTSFGTDGFVVTELGIEESYAYDLVLQTDGKILATGMSDNDTTEDLVLMRLNPDGSTDSTFGVNGLVLYSNIGNSLSIALQSNSKIVVGGFAPNAYDQDFFVARFENGNGSDTPGLYDPAQHLWRLSDSNDKGPYEYLFSFGKTGKTGWLPVVGDWDGDGTDSIGLYDPVQHLWRLRDSNSTGPYEYLFSFGKDGKTGWLPVAGDWDGDGTDTIGLYDPAQHLWRLRDSNDKGPYEYLLSFGKNGKTGWLPVAGDWDGDGTDTIGLYDPEQHIWRLRDSNDTGCYEYLFSFGKTGKTGWLPVVGDWNGDGTDTIGLYDPAQHLWRLRDSNDTGPYEYLFSFGKNDKTGWLPIVGDWDGN